MDTLPTEIMVLFFSNSRKLRRIAQKDERSYSHLGYHGSVFPPLGRAVAIENRTRSLPSGRGFPNANYFFGVRFFMGLAVFGAADSRPPIRVSESAALNGNW